jgi:hypothetical protein
LFRGAVVTSVHERFAMLLFRIVFDRGATVLSRPFVIALLVVGTAQVIAKPAEAGIVTSMEAVSCSSLETAPSQTGREDDSHLHPLLRLLLERSPGLDHAFPTSSSSNGGATGPSSGPMQLPAASAGVFDLHDLNARGWTAPEATLALPPLLPSGLFRPPRSW